MKCRIGLTIFLFSLFALQAQISHPKVSPYAKVEQEVGLSKITVEYSRPAAKGRHIFGYLPDGQSGLVPYGRIWRVGANASTKIKVDSDMQVMGHDLPQGTYAIYAFPDEQEWQVAFHTNTQHWGDGRNDYDSDEDLFRITVEAREIPDHQENLMMAFDSIDHNSANLNIIWASTRVTIPFKVDTEAKMDLEITKQLQENPTAQTFYEVARYLQEEDRDLERALDYLNKALALKGDTYYFHRVKSLVEAGLGDYESAIASAQKSLEIAARLEKDEFVRMNEKNLKKWKALLSKKKQ